jgi:membrane protein DedA with SNARE-associated domain
LVPVPDGIALQLAGMSWTSRTAFLIWDAGGSIPWSGVYIGSGFLFGKEPDRVFWYASVFANTLLLILGIRLLMFLVWRLVQLMRVARTLRLLLVTPRNTHPNTRPTAR